MEKRTLGKSGIKVSAVGLGLMSMSGIYGNANDEESIRVIHHALEQGHQPPRLLRHVRLGPQRDAARASALKGGWRERRDRRHQVRPGEARRRQAGRRRPARIRDAGVRGEPEAPRHRRDRPLLPAPRRPERADRGDRRRDEAAGRAGQGARASASRKRVRRPSAARTRSIRSPRCRTSIRCSTARRARKRSRTTRELGITLVAYAPLGRSMLTGSVQGQGGSARGRPAPRASALPGREPRQEREDGRSASRRSRREKKCTPAQLVLAWLLAQGKDVVADPRHQAQAARRREPRRARRSSCRAADVEDDLRGRAGRRRRRPALSGRAHEARLPLARVRTSDAGRWLLLATLWSLQYIFLRVAVPVFGTAPVAEARALFGALFLVPWVSSFARQRIAPARALARPPRASPGEQRAAVRLLRLCGDLAAGRATSRSSTAWCRSGRGDRRAGARRSRSARGASPASCSASPAWR